MAARRVAFRRLNGDSAGAASPGAATASPTPAAGEGWEPFDHLLLAMGGTPTRPALPDLDAYGVFGVGTLREAEQLRRFIDREHPQHAVVVGAGYVGLEMAEALVRCGLQVTLAGRSPEVMRTLDPEIGTLVTRAVQELGIVTRLSEEMTALETVAVDSATAPATAESTGGPTRRVTGVVTTAGTIPTDVVVLGLGTRPNSDLAREAGLELGYRGSIKVDRTQRTTTEGVWAAGDCAETFNLVSGAPDWVPLATVANKTGRTAGQNIAGGRVTFPGCLGTAITKIGDVEVARTGLQVRDMERLGLDYGVVQIEAMTRSHYCPSKAPLTIRLLGERGSGRLLGGQIVGGPGAGKRIDIVATALHAGMTAEDMLDLDLAYAPPFAPAWEPMLIAVRGLTKKL